MRLMLLAAALSALAAPAFAQLAGAKDPACQAAIAFSAERHGAAVLALKDGRPVCEGYTASGAADHAMEIWSGTKSFSGLMLAAAVQDGLIASIDEPVAKTLPEWRDDPQKAQVTLRQLLSLTSGVRSTVGQVPTYADAIRIPLSTQPGKTFSYGPGPYQVFGEVMHRKLVAAGQPADPYLYLKRRILEPIGLAGEWRHMPNGDAFLPQGAILTVREWVKFGELVRAGGVWKGKALVDRATFAELFKPAPANPAYGVTFWLPNPGVGADGGVGTDLGRDPAIPRDLVLAAGAGNQRLYIIPSRKLVVARLAEFDGRPQGGPRWSDAEFIEHFLH